MLSSSFFVLLIPLSRQIYARFSSLEMSAMIKTLTLCAEWSQFAGDYFRISLILSKSTKLQLLEITSKHCSEAVCTLLLRVVGTITDVACNASISEQGMVNTLTSRGLPAPQC